MNVHGIAVLILGPANPALVALWLVSVLGLAALLVYVLERLSRTR